MDQKCCGWRHTGLQHLSSQPLQFLVYTPTLMLTTTKIKSRHNFPSVTDIWHRHPRRKKKNLLRSPNHSFSLLEPLKIISEQTFSLVWRVGAYLFPSLLSPSLFPQTPEGPWTEPYVCPEHSQDSLSIVLRLSAPQLSAHSHSWLWIVQINNLLDDVHAWLDAWMPRVIYKAHLL